MLKLIKSKLDGIDKEVDDFHPLLEALFRRLPGIQTVYYTHGNSELGADFVITRQDETLGDTEYIGVIAKLGTIKQDSSEINRQIEECGIERILPNSRKIYLNEIWIVSNGTITNNAKIVIHDKYKNKNIKFIGVDKLSSLIEKNMHDYWINIPLKVGEYLHFLVTRVKEIEERSNLLPANASSFYIEPTLSKIETDVYKKKKELKNKSSWKIQELIEKDNRIILEGTMGVGKSKVLREVIKHYANGEIFQSKKLLPIFSTFKDFFDNYQCNPNLLISKTFAEFSIEGNEYSCLLLIDGIDETIIKPDKRVDVLVEMFNQVSPNVKLVVTTRCLDDPDIDARMSTPVTRYDIEPLTTRDIIKFVEHICTNLNITERIIQDLKRSQLFKALPKTPIAAIILAKLLSENAQEIPSNMTELYSKYMELSLGRWDISKGLQSQKEFEALFSIISNLAVHMIDHCLPEISIEEAKRFFANYLQQRNLGITVEHLFEKLTDRCEIIACNNKLNLFAFRHKTFAEYFYAQNLMRKSEVVITEEIYDLYWMNVYFFYVGLKRDCPDLINKIISLKPSNDLTRFLRIINLGNFLLAGFTSPYSVISNGIKEVFDEAVDMYSAIVKRTTENPLSNLSRMELLAIFRTILYESYSYDFFQNAIADALLSGSHDKRPDEEKALLLFFLNMAHIDVGGISLFDDLINQFGANLPMVVQLAIAHEADYAKDKTTAIKKMERRIRRGIKDNPTYNSAIKSMYDRTIKDITIT